jgi:hypothetical protein
MRQLLLPRYKRFDFDKPELEVGKGKEKMSANEATEKVSELFNDYLKELNIYAASKSALMGPIGKVLEQARVRGLDAEFLKGYGISTHKNDPRIRGRLDLQTLQPLEEGIDLLSNLLQKVPRHLRPKVTEIIDYKVYYRREKANVEFWENWRSEFEKFLKTKFENFSELKKKCKIKDKINGREVKDFPDVLRIPRKRRTEELQKLVEEFTAQRKEIIVEEGAEE